MIDQYFKDIEIVILCPTKHRQYYVIVCVYYS